MSTITGPRIGIALGGGSARGLAHISFIEAMDELGLRPSVIAGTSIGSLIGAGWAAGMTGRDIREHSFEVLGDMRSITGRLWQTQMRGFRNVFRSGISMQLDALQITRAFLPPGFTDDFRDLRTPLYIIATDFRSWHQAVFHSGPIVPAIAGSIAIPSLFKPVEFDGRLLVDGGVVNPMPLDAVAADTDILIGIDVNGDPPEHATTRIPSAIDLTLGSAQIMMHSLIAHYIAAYPPDIYIRPHVSAFGAYEYWRVREIVEAGARDKERFKRLLGEKVEAFIAGQQKML
ncbi:patatin-like phospholipase family protein [Mariluticola halotolerans]|uniref:patatin-like phospholipase family protein n=1 Tax=Mariluticola halotolerans TaxID=2909283 RepID=UPI0026E3587B|nr:patatin-like phospholipase family protein [Mariluticola halotolerans]UJQ95869.1 patatin-like phospholipase family protein [Mariluticola halotolerans]